MEYEIPTNAVIQSIDGEYTHKDMEGLRIITDKGSIKLLIDMDGQCCETFGALFLETPDNTDHFIGATINSITDLEVANPEFDDGDEGAETQLRITTSRGVLQYAVYNAHNGYYSHTTFLQVFDVTEQNSL